MKKLFVIGLMLSAGNVFAYDEVDPVPTDINATHDIGMSLHDTQAAMNRSQREMQKNIRQLHKEQADKAARLAKIQGLRNKAATLREATHEANKKLLALKKRQEELLHYQQNLERNEQSIQKEVSRLQYGRHGYGKN